MTADEQAPIDLWGNTFRDIHPGLAPLATWRLSGPEVAPVIRTHDDRLELQWLERQGIHTVGDLLEIGPADISVWRNFGGAKVSRLVSFTQRLDSAATTLLAMQLPQEDEKVPSGVSLAIADTAHDLSTLVEWARFSSGAVTVRDLIRALSRSDGPEDVVTVAEGVLDVALPVDDLEPLEDLRVWMGTLDERDRAVLERRVIRFEEATLDEVGREFGVTRERIRQLEKQLKERLRSWVESEDGRSVRWALHLLSRGVGACAPDSEVPLVGGDGGHSDEFGLLLHLADIVWDRDARTIRRRGFVWPKVGEIPLVDEGPVVDESGLRSTLEARGIVTDHLGWAIGQIHGLKRLDGVLVVWPGNMVDQSVAVLTVSGVPLTDDEILERLERDISVRGLRNRLLDDPRIRRVTKNDFALAAWGMPEYGGIVAAMVQRLEEQGPSTVGELAQHLQEIHSIKPGSVAAYAAAPIFIREGQVLRLRRADEPYSPSLSLPSVKGLFRLGPRRLVWQIPVDREILRGSGRLCPAEIATFIGVYPGRSEILANPVHDVRVTWTATTHMGPTISSLRTHTDALEASEEDRLRLTIDGGARTVDISLAPPSVDSIEGLADLLGLTPEAVSVERLAQALDVQPSEVEDTLRRRGDVDIAEVVTDASALGARPTSPQEKA